MSVQSEIDRLNTAKKSIKTAIESKGVSVPDTTTIDGYAAMISSISPGVESFKGRTGAVMPASGDYTAAQVGAVPTSRTVNGKPLSSNITLSAADVGAGKKLIGSATVNSSVTETDVSLTSAASNFEELEIRIDMPATTDSVGMYMAFNSIGSSKDYSNEGSARTYFQLNDITTNGSIVCATINVYKRQNNITEIVSRQNRAKQSSGLYNDLTNTIWFKGFSTITKFILRASLNTAYTLPIGTKIEIYGG
jgi:hypothetical protein